MRSKLKEILGERGAKQKWLCERVGLSTSAMSQIVRGESLPTLPVAFRIAKGALFTSSSSNGFPWASCKKTEWGVEQPLLWEGSKWQRHYTSVCWEKVM
ncbi:hypothetical protein C2W64_03556 [Brevibacillus laterosporus]|nr:helix-turn-helix transcriptional regulator [Brevibacillus laterosporus]RAP22341.1 hypothetical protein C2W64_03556 [Brevibacillus laterosporus]